MKKKYLVFSVLLVLVCVLMIFVYGNRQNHDDKVVRIGLVVALTGNASGTGQPIANAIDFFREKYPAAYFYVEDSKSTPIGGIQAVHKLIDVYNVDVVFCEMTNVSAAIADYTDRNKVIFIAPIILEDFVSNWGYTIRDFMTLHEQAKVDLAEYKSKHLSEGTNLVAIVSNDEFGRSSLNGIRQAAAESPINLLESCTFDNDPETIKNVVINVLTKKPDVIFASSFSPSLGLLIKELRVAGYSGYVLTTTAFTAPSIQTAAGDGLWGIIHADLNQTDVYAQLSDWYSKKYSEKPTLTTFLCHDGIAVIMEAYDIAGTKDPQAVLDSLDKVFVRNGAYGELTVHNREVKFKLTTNTIDKR